MHIFYIFKFLKSCSVIFLHFRMFNSKKRGRKENWLAKILDMKSLPLCFEDDEVVDFGKHSISSAKEQQFSLIEKKMYVISHKKICNIQR